MPGAIGRVLAVVKERYEGTYDKDPTRLVKEFNLLGLVLFHQRARLNLFESRIGRSDHGDPGIKGARQDRLEEVFIVAVGVEGGTVARDVSELAQRAEEILSQGIDVSDGGGVDKVLRELSDGRLGVGRAYLFTESAERGISEVPRGIERPEV